jgi:hypothetical protein
MRPDHVRLYPVQTSLRALPVSSGYIGYEHAWSRALTTVVTYGVVNVSNLAIQPGDAFHKTQRTSINLMWNPVPFVDIVVEYLAGTRVDKNGKRAASSSDSEWMDAQIPTRGRAISRPKLRSMRPLRQPSQGAFV